jgi:hypothetical protein
MFQVFGTAVDQICLSGIRKYCCIGAWLRICGGQLFQFDPE